MSGRRCCGMTPDISDFSKVINIIGMITVDQFGQMMYKDELFGNMVYVIHGS